MSAGYKYDVAAATGLKASRRTWATELPLPLAKSSCTGFTACTQLLMTSCVASQQQKSTHQVALVAKLAQLRGASPSIVLIMLRPARLYRLEHQVL